jgi:hypothetical protein
MFRVATLKADLEKNAMTMLITTLATFAVGTVLATSAFAQSAREIRGGSPYVAIENEPPALHHSPASLATNQRHAASDLFRARRSSVAFGDRWA